MSFYNGTITGVAAGVPGSWKAEFQTPAGPRTMVLSQIETECCMQSYNSYGFILYLGVYICVSLYRNI